MIAKRNAEVEKLNEMARAVMREAGKLGARGDRSRRATLRRRRPGHHPRQRPPSRHLQPRALAGRRGRRRADRRVVLEGIDQARRVEVDADYLARTNPHYDAPALEHAYAVTTYSAQGTTVDRAYVMADPSMDKQELYVAASRSREETYLYATPEIQAQREEIAPRSPYLREGLPHIAEAAERDRAQLAAHDVAQLRGAADRELVKRRFSSPLRPSRSRSSRRAPRERAAADRGGQGEARPSHPGCEPPRRCRARSAKRACLRQRPRGTVRAGIERLQAGLEGMPQVGRQAGPSWRRRAAPSRAPRNWRSRRPHCPARLHHEELGERPTDPTRRKAWERGVEGIERYRQEHGINDRARRSGPSREAAPSAQAP